MFSACSCSDADDCAASWPLSLSIVSCASFTSAVSLASACSFASSLSVSVSTSCFRWSPSPPAALMLSLIEASGPPAAAAGAAAGAAAFGISIFISWPGAYPSGTVTVTCCPLGAVTCSSVPGTASSGTVSAIFSGDGAAAGTSTVRSCPGAYPSGTVTVTCWPLGAVTCS